MNVIHDVQMSTPETSPNRLSHLGMTFGSSEAPAERGDPQAERGKRRQEEAEVKDAEHLDHREEVVAACADPFQVST